MPGSKPTFQLANDEMELGLGEELPPPCAKLLGGMGPHDPCPNPRHQRGVTLLPFCRDPRRGWRAQNESEHRSFTPSSLCVSSLPSHSPCVPQVMPVDEAVETMLAHMTDPSNASHLPLSPGESPWPLCTSCATSGALTLLTAPQEPLWCWW